MTPPLSIPSEVRQNFCELPCLQEVNSLANLTESLDSSVLDFTPGSFIGRSVRSSRPDDLHYLIPS